MGTSAERLIGYNVTSRSKRSAVAGEKIVVAGVLMLNFLVQTWPSAGDANFHDFVIPREAGKLHFAGKNRSFALLRMTISWS
jgi:hypothetical protein